MVVVEVAMDRYAARRDEVRERFISILGHDLRDPLATARISAKVLAGDPELDDEHPQEPVRAHGAVDRLRDRAEILPDQHRPGPMRFNDSSAMGVRTQPGETRFTRTRGASSTAIDIIIDWSAPLDAA